MPKSFNRIWIHSIWSTKHRLPLIEPKNENIIHDFIKNELREMGCPVGAVNGMSDHVHCLFLLSPNKSVSEVIKQIKGSSSHFINQNNLSKIRFSWQTGYASYLVSDSVQGRVYQYIMNQKSQHRKK